MLVKQSLCIFNSIKWQNTTYTTLQILLKQINLQATGALDDLTHFSYANSRGYG